MEKSEPLGSATRSERNLEDRAELLKSLRGKRKEAMPKHTLFGSSTWLISNYDFIYIV